MKRDAVNGGGIAKAAVERRRERIINALRGNADDHRPTENERCRIVAVHHVTDALERKGVAAA
ncbi:MAG TPA: hypothetical protein VMS01_00665, partial [Stellaceae bacterium]|nr:hypothetical protein [Stellaceae bacterium]